MYWALDVGLACFRDGVSLLVDMEGDSVRGELLVSAVLEKGIWKGKRDINPKCISPFVRSLYFKSEKPEKSSQKEWTGKEVYVEHKREWET
ncbi:hypothetical protein TNCV_975631 [Trichonephila clavipes]|nr:hypothetical protein TNCV_975631 [Trichonephila clavipes]